MASTQCPACFGGRHYNSEFQAKKELLHRESFIFFKTLKALILHYSQKSFPFLLCINQSSNKTIKNPTATIKMSQNFFAKYFKGHDIHLKKKMVSTYSLNSAYSRSRIACVDWKIRGTGWLQWLYIHSLIRISPRALTKHTITEKVPSPQHAAPKDKARTPDAWAYAHVQAWQHGS